MKTLHIIQVLSKAGKIISKILFVCSIVGFCGGVAGIVGLAIGSEVLKLGDFTIHGLIGNGAEINRPILYVILAVAILFCAAEAVLCKFAEIYFKNELTEGTPFTLRGAKELMRLGSLTIAIPLGTEVVCSIGVAVAARCFPAVEQVPNFEFSSVGLGIFMLVLSLICRYGAEMFEKAKENVEGYPSQNIQG